jgi:hypothetical protein
MGDVGYALELMSPIRHVATELDRVFPQALSIPELAADYVHSVPSDLSRIKFHEHMPNDEAATQWLISEAVKELGDQVIPVDGGWRLTVLFQNLRYMDSPVTRATKSDSSDDRRTLKAAYNNLCEHRAIHVLVNGRRDGIRERRFEIHPLARGIDPPDEALFMDLAQDISLFGVIIPPVLYLGQVLDGRARLAIAGVLGVPVEVEEFFGMEADARHRVRSLNLCRCYEPAKPEPEIVHFPAPGRRLNKRQVTEGILCEITRLLREYGPLTDEEIRGFMAENQELAPYVTDGGLRTRRGVLVHRGIVRNTGERRRTKAGHPSTLWGLTEDVHQD